MKMICSIIQGLCWYNPVVIHVLLRCEHDVWRTCTWCAWCSCTCYVHKFEVCPWEVRMLSLLSIWSNVTHIFGSPALHTNFMHLFNTHFSVSSWMLVLLAQTLSNIIVVVHCLAEWLVSLLSFSILNFFYAVCDFNTFLAYLWWKSLGFWSWLARSSIKCLGAWILNVLCIWLLQLGRIQVLVILALHAPFVVKTYKNWTPNMRIWNMIEVMNDWFSRNSCLVCWHWHPQIIRCQTGSSGTNENIVELGNVRHLMRNHVIG